MKLNFHEAQRVADIKDTLSNSESVLERQGLQQFPERIVHHFKSGEHQVFLSVSQQRAWLEVSMTALSWQVKPPLSVHTDFAGHRLSVCWSMLLCTYLTPLLCPHTLGSQQAPSEEYLTHPVRYPRPLPWMSYSICQWLRLLHHANQREGVHCIMDRGLLTLIWSDTVEGLQVKLVLPFHPYKHVPTYTCSSLTMPECLLHVLVTACKPVRCRFSACIEPIGMHCRWSTLRLACLRMFSCQRDTS